jgi:hypothetical protein
MLCAAAAAGARADETPVDPDLSTRGLRRAGPFHVRPLVLVRDVGYDDNIRFDAQEPEGDTTATAGAGLQALLLTGDRGGLRLYQEFDYVAFGRNPDLNHWNNSTRARGLLVLRRFLVSLEDRFESTRERPNTEVDHRLRRRNNAATLSARTLNRGRLGIRAFVRHESLDFASAEEGTEDLVRRLNRDEESLVIAGELRLLPKTTFILEGVLERVEFEEAAEGRNTRARSVLSGFRFDPSASVQGEFKLGVIALEAPDRPQSDFRGTIGEGHLTRRLGRAARAKAGFERALEFSILADNLYFVRTAWSLAYEQFFSRRLSAEIAYGRGRNRYPEEVTRAGTEPFEGLRADRLTTHEMSVRYRINEQLSMVVSAYRLRRDSNDDFHDRERNFYTFGSTYGF